MEREHILHVGAHVMPHSATSDLVPIMKNNILTHFIHTQKII